MIKLLIPLLIFSTIAKAMPITTYENLQPLPNFIRELNQKKSKDNFNLNNIQLTGIIIFGKLKQASILINDNYTIVKINDNIDAGHCKIIDINLAGIICQLKSGKKLNLYLQHKLI